MQFLQTAELLQRGLKLERRGTIGDLPDSQQLRRRIRPRETRTLPARPMFRQPPPDIRGNTNV